jgi:hypothetical protein
MAPVAGHLTPDTSRSHPPGHPVRPQDDVATHRTGRRKQRTVNPLMAPARYNFLYSSSRPALRPAATRRPPGAGLTLTPGDPERHQASAGQATVLGDLPDSREQGTKPEPGGWP